MRAAVLVATVALAGTGLAGCSDDGADPVARQPTPTTERPGAVSVYDLGIGDCVNGLSANQDVRVRVVPCRRPHEAEVYGVVTLGARRFPGADVLRLEAATQCAQRFAGYTGEPAGPGTDVAFAEVVPTLASWSAGDRTALCLALGVDGVPLQGSIASDGGR